MALSRLRNAGESEWLEWKDEREAAGLSLWEKPRSGGMPRPSHGEANGHTKLTEVDVLDIRDLVTKESLRAVAKRYKIEKKTVAMIRDRKLWSHVA